MVTNSLSSYPANSNFLPQRRSHHHLSFLELFGASSTENCVVTRPTASGSLFKEPMCNDRADSISVMTSMCQSNKIIPSRSQHRRENTVKSCNCLGHSTNTPIQSINCNENVQMAAESDSTRKLGKASSGSSITSCVTLPAVMDTELSSIRLKHPNLMSSRHVHSRSFGASDSPDLDSRSGPAARLFLGSEREWSERIRTAHMIEGVRFHERRTDLDDGHSHGVFISQACPSLVGGRSQVFSGGRRCGSPYASLVQGLRGVQKSMLDRNVAKEKHEFSAKKQASTHVSSKVEVKDGVTMKARFVENDEINVLEGFFQIINGRDHSIEVQVDLKNPDAKAKLSLNHTFTPKIIVEPGKRKSLGQITTSADLSIKWAWQKLLPKPRVRVTASDFQGVELIRTVYPGANPTENARIVFSGRNVRDNAVTIEICVSGLGIRESPLVEPTSFRQISHSSAGPPFAEFRCVLPSDGKAHEIGEIEGVGNAKVEVEWGWSCVGDLPSRKYAGKLEPECANSKDTLLGLIKRSRFKRAEVGDVLTNME